MNKIQVKQMWADDNMPFILMAMEQYFEDCDAIYAVEAISAFTAIQQDIVKFSYWGNAYDMLMICS